MGDPIILDGREFARRRLPSLAARAGAIRTRRGRAPALAIVTFAERGAEARFLERKVRACAAAGVEVRPVVLPAHASTAQVVDAVRTAADVDGIFVEVPLPAGVDASAVFAALPPVLDLDVMTPARTQAYLGGAGSPPVTASAALGLLEMFGVSIDRLGGVVVAEPSDYAEMFRVAFERAGARMRLVAPGTPLGDAEIVIAMVGRPGALRSTDAAAGAVVIDVGYYNADGRGDVDTSGGIEHLRALAPVPGGIGPATVSALVERVIEFGEG